MSRLDANLEVLRAAHPEIDPETMRTLETGAGEEPAAVPTPSGAPTAKLGDAFIHSRYDPVKEASGVVLRGGIEGSSVVIVLGFGFGYAAEDAWRRFPAVPILVVEPEAGFFRAALRARDLRGLLGAASVRFCLSQPAGGVMRHLESLPMEKPAILRLRAVTDGNPAFFRSVEQIVGSFMLRRDININTLGRFGRVWVRNLARNMDLFAQSPGIGILSGIFEGIPALLLAGGPSFDQIAPFLRELSQRLLVVCVDTPLRPCLQRGVKPDVVVMVDPQYWATRYLDWTGDYDGLLVAEPSTHPRSLRHPGRLHLFCGSLFPLGAYLESAVGEKGKLGAGGSVSTSAWDLCRHMGSNPVYASGLDLGFPDLKTHCAGAFFEQAWFASSLRTRPVEGNAFRYLREIGVFPMRSNAGGQTLTDRRMMLYKWWFESQFPARPDMRTYSLSRGAVAVDGMPLADVNALLELPRIRPEIDGRIAGVRRKALRPEAAVEKAAALDAALAGLLNGLSKLHDAATRALGLTHELSAAHARGRDCGPLLRRLDALDRGILELSTRDIAGFLMQGLIQKITGGGTTDGAIETSRAMYEGMRESAAFHLSVLSRARGGLQEKKKQASFYMPGSRDSG